MASDFAPGFTFDGFGGAENEAQAPWEFGGALAQAEKEAVGASNATSIDYKIAQQLARNKRPATKQAAKHSRTQAKRQAKAASSDSEVEEEEDASEDDSDAPLPGELDESDEDEEEADVDLEEAAGAGSDEEEEDDEEQAGSGNEEEEEEEEEGSEDEIAKAVMEMDSDDLAASSDEEEEEERQQQAAPVTGKRKREQQVQQAQEAQRPQRGAAAGAADGGGEAAQQQEQQGGKRQKGFFDATPKDTRFSAKSFADLHLSRPLLKACQALGYTHPTPIQAACIPLALAGRDICGSAVTGSGKTAAFTLPLLERLLHRNKRVAATYVLVLTPVRELAVQVHSMVQKLAQFTDIRAALVVGGLSLQAQAATLREQPEIVVATPGRMIDHLRNTQSVGLEDLSVLVLDEADRLLEMGFAEEINEVVKMAPVRRQTMLFSATMTEEVKKLVALSLKHPVRLAADAAAAAPRELTQEIVRLKGGAAAQKEATLLAVCSKSFRKGRTIIFAKTKQRAHRLKMLFGLAGLPPTGELHGDMTQAARLESLERFRKGEVAFLLATDVAARGLDILGVETVINFDCPTQLSSYLHRVGRTARAGAKGRALTFIEDGDRPLLKEVIKRTGVQMQQRQVQAPAIASWQNKVEKLEPQVAAIIQEEREERALRKAEMEAQKAANMLEHEEEIMARPARTWFQTERQKKEVARRAKDAAENGGGEESEDDEGGDTGMSSKQKKNKAKNERRLEQKQQRAKEAAENRKKSNKLMEETAAVSRSIKAVKAREQKLRLEGVTGGKAGKMAAAQVTGVKRKKQKKKGKDKEGKGKAEGELFSGDGLPSKPAGKSKVYAGGAHSGKLKVPRPSKSKSELNKIKRGGKGKHGFKSKAKHRRR